jgi:hypothetical protein
MTIPMNIHPKYIIDDNGKKVSVVLDIEEFNTLIDQSNSQDLSHLNSLIKDGFNSPISTKTHQEIFKELKSKYA